jgi:hypothetical protein
MAREPKLAPIDPNLPYTREVLRHQRHLEMREAQEQAEEVERIGGLEPEEQANIAALAEAQRIMARLPPAEKVENDSPPNLSAAWQIMRRDGYDGPEWCAVVSVIRAAGGAEEHSTGWLPRARFFAECAVLRRHFNDVLFDGIGSPRVW